jgi:hypothetical protein
MTFAIQPSAWGSFDSYGCDWASTIEQAYRIGQAWGEECMIWMVPQNGTPVRWCRTDSNTNAIADLVFGVGR